MNLRDLGSKLPGKTPYAGRRRASSRRSGYKAHAETTGGEFRRIKVPLAILHPGEKAIVEFRIPAVPKSELIGFGFWYWSSRKAHVSIHGFEGNVTNTQYAALSWNKVGSIWSGNISGTSKVSVTITPTGDESLEFASYGSCGGVLFHEYLRSARKVLLRNMWQFAPEAIITKDSGAARLLVAIPGRPGAKTRELILKSCNRCGRFLPINCEKETDHLSFSNHCTASHRRPCKHPLFSSLRNVEHEGDKLSLEYGFQLECRFCKKFAVNAALNPQRTAAQMKEDAARRRYFELLLAELNQGAPQFSYRCDYGSELAEDVWERFNRKCFNCLRPLATARQMHLDHTRPLALLWPLDKTATALCSACNSAKRDRYPSDFYSPDQLVQLARTTGIALDSLQRPRPNDQAIGVLASRLDWFFDEFLTRPDMIRERDGKVTGELVVKALQKAISASSRFGSKLDLVREYKLRRNQ